MVSVLERSGFETYPGILRCVHGQDTLLSQCLSPPRCIKGYRRFYSPHPGGSKKNPGGCRKIPGRFMLQKLG